MNGTEIISYLATNAPALLTGGGSYCWFVTNRAVLEKEYYNYRI